MTRAASTPTRCAQPTPYFATARKCSVTGGTYTLAITQEHGALEGRGPDITREATLDELQGASPTFAKTMGMDAHIPPNVSLYSHPPLERRASVGHDRRPEHLHRLLRVHGRLPGGEQHPDRRQAPGHRRPRDALDSHRPLLRQRWTSNDSTIRRWSRSR